MSVQYKHIHFLKLCHSSSQHDQPHYWVFYQDICLMTASLLHLAEASVRIDNIFFTSHTIYFQTLCEGMRDNTDWKIVDRAIPTPTVAIRFNTKSHPHHEVWIMISDGSRSQMDGSARKSNKMCITFDSVRRSGLIEHLETYITDQPTIPHTYTSLHEYPRMDNVKSS